MHNYDDIINLQHHVSSKRKPMSLYNRAAQFAPFAALTGYDEQINEEGRIVQEKLELDTDRVNMINDKLNYINNNIKDNIKVEVEYFVKDRFKDGGIYETYTGIIKRIDTVNKRIIFKNNYEILFDNIYDIYF